jgi:subtilisin family serine protease
MDVLRRRARLLSLIVLSWGVLIAGPGSLAQIGERRAWADELMVDQRVRDRVGARGNARILVELRLPHGRHVPEGALPSPSAVVAQRADIRSSGAQIMAKLRGFRHRLANAYQTVPLLALEVGPDALAGLEASSHLVQRVMTDGLRSPVLAQSVPLVEGPQAWAAGFDGTGVAVAIVDTGVDGAHPFLANKVVEEACFSTTSATLSSSSVCPGGQDVEIGVGAGVPCAALVLGCWHGTHVAGIAAGNGSQAGQPFSGVAKGAQIIAVQVFSLIDDPGECAGPSPCVEAWDSDIIAGLERVYALRGQHQIAAVNLSLGSGLFSTACDDEPEKSIIDNLRSAGIATVVASGNDGATGAISSPACISTAVSVSATDKTDVVAPYANVDRLLSLFAPGSSILSSYPGGLWLTASGTSMATPHVTGAVAILRQAAPAATVQTLVTALEQTGLLITDTRPGGRFALPRIRIAHALELFVANPVPVVSSIAPDGAAAGGPAFTLTVSGQGFVPGSVVRWKGVNRATTFVNSGKLTAAIGASDLATAGIAQVSVFTGPPGGGVSNSMPFSVVAPVSGNLSLTVRKLGAGAGRVKSVPAGIDCGSVCSKSFARGAVVTLTATPEPRSKFTGWTGACTGKSTCKVTMSSARSVTATFRRGR